MKKWYGKGPAIIILFLIGSIIAFIGHFYFQYISERVYEDSTSHLKEVYGQVNNSFSVFLEETWGHLDDWTHHIQIENDEKTLNFIQGRQKYWKFSAFYFLSSNGNYITPEGEKGQLLLEGSKEKLFQHGEQIMVNETLPSGQAVTIFASPVPMGTYRGFDYTALAISYTNADIIHSLDVEAFSGQSKCFVVYTDGSVLFSPQIGGSVFGNYISYLKAGSDLNEEELLELRENWERGISGVFSCQIGGVNHYICYQPVGYQDCILLGIVPQSAASASLLQIQKATIDVLFKVFLLIGIYIVAHLIYSNRQKTRKNVLELKYRELMFDALSNNVDDIFLMLDNETWKVDYLSPNVERLLGIPLEDAMKNVRLIGESVVDTYGFISKEEFDAIPIGSYRQWERQYIHQKTGERHWYRETVYHENLQGIEKFVVVMSDRTQEQQMNMNLQDALDAAKSANEAKSSFLSNMSHDIRTPMNAIVGFTVLLAKDAEQPEKIREYTRKISASSQHLLGLINDILDMSKIESGKTSLNVSQFSLPELLEELHTILLPQAKAKNQKFHFHVQGNPAELLLGDKLRLNQILINLLSNAIKYTPEGGNISFYVKELESSPQYANIRFIIKDNGIGMSPEYLETIFEPFSREVKSTTNGIQGTGLGMAITKNLIDLMGGIIQVDSKPGQGSTFTVELSFAVSTSSRDEKFWERKGISKVLVADDEEEICLNIQNMMEETGVTISYVTDGLSAVKAASHAKECGENFNAIILDWKMPGLSGIETARQIREEIKEDIPILVLTSYDWSDIEDEARAAGIDAFLPKPFFVSSFQQVLESIDSNVQGTITEETQEHILEGMLFLVAEDVELNAEILSEMLKMEDAQCEIALNGKEALEMFCQSEPDYYDMILMDVQMPVMNGYEATRKIRASDHPRAKDIPIIAMTANAFAEDVRNALDSGMNGHLSKPIDMNTVKSLLGQLKKSGHGEGKKEKGDSDV